jgi:hypothetical protein
MAKLFLTVALAWLLPATIAAQAPVGDRDDQFVATGCVMPTADFRSAGPQSLFVWSRGDVYLAFADVRFRPADTDRPIGTAGPFMPVFYWIDDENDFAKYAGQHVEIVGELSDELREGEIKIEAKGDFTEIEFDAGGREATARIPTAWFGPATRGRDIEKDVVVRTVDVEKVTVLGECKTR